MKISTIGVELAKSVFQVPGGSTLSLQLRGRPQMTMPSRGQRVEP